MTLGEKIRVLRQKEGLSQAQLAQQLHVSRAAIAKWENNNGIPDVVNLKALSAHFGCDLDLLLDESTGLPQVRNAVGAEEVYESTAMLQESEKQRQNREIRHGQACFLKRYLWLLVGLSATQLAIDLLFSEWLLGSIAILKTISQILRSILYVAHGVVLLHISGMDKRLKIAGCCMLTYALCNLLMILPVIVEASSWIALLISVVALVIDLYRVYYECSAFGGIIEIFDGEMTKKWTHAYAFYIASDVAVLFGLLLTVIFKTLGLLLIFVSSICSFIASFKILSCRYSTAEIILRDV